jgi:hypothetical protein
MTILDRVDYYLYWKIFTIILFKPFMNFMLIIYYIQEKEP